LNAAFVLWFGGCLPEAPAVAACDDVVADGVRVGPVCGERRPPGGEADADDVWMGTSEVRAVIRHPAAAVSRPGASGGSVVDLAPTGGVDAVHEIVPWVDGGPFDVEGWSDDADGVTVWSPEGQEVRYTLDPVARTLDVTGADGLWVHPRGAPALVGAALLGDVWLGTDATTVVDEGGAVRFDGAARIAVGRPGDDVWLGARVVAVSGAAPDADALEVATPAGAFRWELDGAVFVGVVPAQATAVRAVGVGRAPSPWAAPGTGLDLPVGPRADVTARIIGAPRAVTVRHDEADGRRGAVVLPPEGGVVPVGSGDVTLWFDAGPGFEPVAVATTGGASIDVHLEPAFVAGDFVPVRLNVRSDRDRRIRVTDVRAVDAAAGAALAVRVALDDVPARLDDTLGRHRDGVAHTGSAFALWSWPWEPVSRQPAHGAPDVAALDPWSAAGAAWGGPGVDRFMVADLRWFAAVSPEVRPARPIAVQLDAPDADLTSWGPWFEWIDARIPVSPVAEVTWVAVPEPAAPMAVEVERGLLHGAVVAGTGGWLDVDVEGVGPGGVVSLDKNLAAVDGIDVEVRPLGLEVDRVWVRAHGRVASVAVRPDGGAWTRVAARPGSVVVAAIEADGGFVVAAPVWLDAP
jgi:hypothetical protein